MRPVCSQEAKQQRRLNVSVGGRMSARGHVAHVERMGRVVQAMRNGHRWRWPETSGASGVKSSPEPASSGLRNHEAMQSGTGL